MNIGVLDVMTIMFFWLVFKWVDRFAMVALIGGIVKAVKSKAGEVLQDATGSADGKGD